MWSRGWGRKEAAAPRGPGVAAPDRGSGGCGAGAERGEGVYGAGWGGSLRGWGRGRRGARGEVQSAARAGSG